MEGSGALENIGLAQISPGMEKLIMEKHCTQQQKKIGQFKKKKIRDFFM